MNNTKRIPLQIGDIIETRKSDGPTREFYGVGERRVVVSVEDNHAVLVTIGNTSKVTTLLSIIDVKTDEGKYKGYIVGTIDKFLISRDLDEQI